MDLSVSNISPKLFLLVEALIKAYLSFTENLFAQKIFENSTLNIYILLDNFLTWFQSYCSEELIYYLISHHLTILLCHITLSVLTPVILCASLLFSCFFLSNYSSFKGQLKCHTCVHASNFLHLFKIHIFLLIVKTFLYLFLVLVTFR